ncbi:GNAT family N-acetyltransferase [Pseudodonghicola flavimaris]|uniref:GNAT family N-acetyltransferase n=1 Tax=Pseudodonghicola flavimaris TaxID=3050036 RepID=A0ABT7F6N8_9RHOB|nr:GNAT family N-acetyltransferase [Pseudodonghicola flavimaris]MDK3020269.1 GNAT family N-acetyltransferase [Pseudodonghicola flavimaris]
MTSFLIPTLETDRLTLRAPKLSDFERWAEFFATERARYERGILSRDQAWRVWASDVAIWTLRGYGPFGIDDRTTGQYLGEVGIYEPDGYPGPELGWFVVPEAEGKGIASEAARAVMLWARRNFGWDEVTNIIDPNNDRSIALGLRLGGVIDPDRAGEDPGDVVIVHDLRGLA